MHIPRVIIIGESHVDAIKKAYVVRSPGLYRDRIKLYRVSKLKNGVLVGDVSKQGFIDSCSDLEPDAIIVSAIGGNLHQKFGLIRHPVPFDIFETGDIQMNIQDNVYYIPSNTIRDYFEQELTSKEGCMLKEIRKVTRCTIIHLEAPPPKQNEEHINKYHETHFINRGILEKGITPAYTRLKLWKLQSQVMKKLCDEWGIKFLSVPAESLCADGFLKPEYYNHDATHANTAYGELVLQQLETIMSNISGQ